MFSNPFRSQNRCQTDLIDEVVEAFPENLSNVLHRNIIKVIDVINRFQEPFLGEIAAEDALVDVLPASFQVDESNDVVENGRDFF